MLTTKAGLAQSLKDYAASSGVNVDSFFPRCHLEFVWPIMPMIGRFGPFVKTVSGCFDYCQIVRDW